MVTVGFSNDQDNRDLNALNLFIENRADIESRLQSQSKSQMQNWSSIRELFASSVYQTLTTQGVELVQCEMTLDELDSAVEKWESAEYGIIAKMIGIRSPFSGRPEFVQLQARFARTIYCIQSG